MGSELMPSALYTVREPQRGENIYLLLVKLNAAIFLYK